MSFEIIEQLILFGIAAAPIGLVIFFLGILTGSETITHLLAGFVGAGSVLTLY